MYEQGAPVNPKPLRRWSRWRGKAAACWRWGGRARPSRSSRPSPHKGLRIVLKWVSQGNLGPGSSDFQGETRFPWASHALQAPPRVRVSLNGAPHSRSPSECQSHDVNHRYFNRNLNQGLVGIYVGTVWDFHAVKVPYGSRVMGTLWKLERVALQHSG